MRFFLAERSWQFILTCSLIHWKTREKLSSQAGIMFTIKMLSFWNNLHHVHAQCQNIESDTI